MGFNYNFDAIPSAKTQVDALEELAKRELPRLAEMGVETAKQSGSATFMEDAKNAQEVLRALLDSTIKFIGQEGDNVTGEGTLRGMIGAAETISKTMGEG